MTILARRTAPWMLAMGAAFGALLDTAEGQDAPAAEATVPSADEVSARAGELVADGRAAEAEDLLREAVNDQRSPRLLADLAGVLLLRSGELDETSELGKALRHGVLEEALDLYGEVARSPEFEAEGVLGRASCQEMLERGEEADATLRTALKSMRERSAAVEQRRAIVEALVVRQARVDAAAVQAVIEEARDAGELDAAMAALEQLRAAAVLRVPGKTVELAAAALDAGASTADTAYLAWDAVGGERLEEMLSVYSRLLERRPGDPTLHFYRGVARLRLSDAAGARSDLERAVGDPSLGQRARVELGHALLRLGLLEDALPHLQAGLVGDAGILNRATLGLAEIAVRHARARKFEAALAIYRQILEHDPTNLWARLGEPLSWRNLGDPERAIAAYEAGITALPDEPQLVNDFALLLQSRGERARAEELFQRALASGAVPAGADGGENLGIRAYREDRDVVTAARYFARTLLLDPSRPRIRFYRELCLCDAPP